jgi:hypothetical protein
MNTAEMMSIPLKEYKELKEDSKMLLVLQEAGVDNWDGYRYALEALEEMSDD